MAASTWFQGSECPPGNHGIMPSGSCTSAMASTVATTSSASRTPGISGSSTGRLLRSGQRGGGLGGVHDEALADEGVEGSFDEAHGPGRVDDVPRQEAVIRAGQWMGVGVAAARALVSDVW